MGSATGLQIGGFDFDGAQDTVVVDFLANAEFRQLIRSAVADRDGAVLKNNLICRALCPFQNFFGRFGAAQIDGANLGSEMEGNRRASEAFLKHGGEEMLAGVLLHVVEAARPVDAALRFAGIQRSINDVDDFIFVLAHVQNIGVAKFPEVVRLAAGTRIKSSAIEDDFPGRSLRLRPGASRSSS